MKKFMMRLLVGVCVWTCMVVLRVIIQNETFDFMVWIQLGVILALIGEGAVRLGDWAATDL